MNATEVDVLLICPSSTAGWRRGDAELADVLRELGLEIAVSTADFRRARHFRRTMLTTDLAEAAALRRATTRALRRYRPRAIIYSSPQAAMLQPRARLRGATAVRFDVPAAFNRRGLGSRLLHALERRALGRVRLLLPIGVEPGAEAREVARNKPLVALPFPIAIPVEDGRSRAPIALAYAGNPNKKGLDLIVEAWGSVAPSGWRLAVTGIDARSARRFLAERGIAEPLAVEWHGMLPSERHRELLDRASVYLSASRYEDYGIAQLEALATGMLLVTTPSDGPYAALRVVRELDSRLVADDTSAAGLARALRAALALDDEQRRSYQQRARSRLRPHSRDELKRRLQEQVLPMLLAER